MTHVLVVDDDAHLLRTLRIHLTAHGYTVATADTGRDAITTAAADHPDLIVLDLGLPDIDGTAVITALRATSTMPIIVLSAVPTPRTRCRPSTPAPTTTSPNPSASPSSSPG